MDEIEIASPSSSSGHRNEIMDYFAIAIKRWLLSLHQNVFWHVLNERRDLLSKRGKKWTQRLGPPISPSSLLWNLWPWLCIHALSILFFIFYGGLMKTCLLNLFIVMTGYLHKASSMEVNSLCPCLLIYAGNDVWAVFAVLLQGIWETDRLQ